MPKKPTYEELEKKVRKLEQTKSKNKHSEEQLIHSHKLMDYIISHARSAIAVHDRDLKYIYVSERYLKEYKVKEQDVIGKRHYDVFPDLPQKWRDVHQRSLAGEVLSAEEDPYYREDGSVDWTRWECRPWYESDGSIGGIIIYTEVINERKQAKKKLQRSEALLNSTQQLTKVGGWEWDVEKQTMFWTNEVYRIHDLNRSELKPGSTKHIERSIECYDPEDRPIILEAFRNCAEKRQAYDLELPFTTVMDRRIWVRTVAEPVLESNKVVKVVGSIMDITERKKAERALQQSEAKYRSMMESMKDCALICSPELRIEYMNPTMVDRIGRDATGEICHKAIYDRDEKCSWCVFDQVQQKEHVEYEMADPKDNRYYSVTNSPISYTNGAVSKLTIFHDITEIKTMEGNLRQARKLESIGTLTGGIAHDFNNILGIIAGNTELALIDIPEWNPVHSNLEEIKTASLRAINIVKQLLAFSRKTDQKLQPIEIALVIKDVIKFLRSTIPTTIDIQQDIQVTDETVLVDPTEINQIMMNLCINASHAMEQTGGKLTINVDKVILDDNSAKDYPDLRNGKHIKVTVIDTGLGIAPEIIDRIFDPYFTTKAVGKGSGMGLAVVQGIVKNHNGAISADSKPGKGTTFTILFPLAEGKAAVETETIQEILTGHETILFVDDEISIVKMVRKMLELLKYQVETAMTPLNALEQFNSDPDRFDLVITDMTMPQMTGVKLSEKLMDIRPDIPIIICTGHSALVDEEKAKELGLAAYVMKPINMREVAQTIRKVLDEAKGSQG